MADEKYKLTVTFTLKSGKEIVVKCAEFKIQKHGNELKGYTIEGMPIGSLFYLRLDEIAAIQYVMNDDVS